MARLVYLIEMAGADGRPTYYSPEAGRSTGHGANGWILEKEEALGFATGHDAQRFIDACMPRTANTLRPVPHTRRE